MWLSGSLLKFLPNFCQIVSVEELLIKWVVEYFYLNVWLNVPYLLSQYWLVRSVNTCDINVRTEELDMGVVCMQICMLVLSQFNPTVNGDVEGNCGMQLL